MSQALFRQYLDQFNFSRVHFEKKAGLRIEDITLADAERMADNLVAHMSPENLTCDGELSRSQVQARARLYRGAAQYLKGRFPSLSPEWDDGQLFASSGQPSVEFAVGDHVEINHAKLGGRARGVILKVNRVRCRVQFAQGTFTVPFGMMQQVAKDLA
jgi:hypothetical protein